MYIYKLTFPDGMMYIGKTCDPKNRWNGANKGYNNEPMKSAIATAGWANIKNEILFSGLPRIEAMRTEARLIKENENKCYNIIWTTRHSGLYSQDGMRKGKKAPSHIAIGGDKE